MGRIRECKNCNQVSFIHARDMCYRCYFKKHNQKSEVKERKRRWMRESGYGMAHYEKNKDYYKEYRKYYSKTDKYKEIKRKFDIKNRNKIRFGGNREKVLIRDNFQCRICSSEENLIIHHIDGKNERTYKGASNHLIENLITLCKKCHRKVHRKYNPVPIPNFI